MRINVYAEEMTDNVELVSKTVTDDEFGERIFYGVRVYLKSPPELHHSIEDDDRSAITFWVKWTKTGGTNTCPLGIVVNRMTNILAEVLCLTTQTKPLP